MDERIAWLIGLLGASSTIISIIIGYGTLKRRAVEPIENKWKEIDEWRDKTDALFAQITRELEQDDYQIKKLEELAEGNLEFQRALLVSIDFILETLHRQNIKDNQEENEELKVIRKSLKDLLLKRYK